MTSSEPAPHQQPPADTTEPPEADAQQEADGGTANAQPQETDQLLPFDARAWALSLRTARTLLLVSNTGHAGTLWVVALALAVAGRWWWWTLPVAVVTAAAAVRLGRLAKWLAHSLYPGVYALVHAVGPEDAREVCTAFATSGHMVTLPPPVALVASIAQQRHDAKALGCADGHRALCPHRTPVPVPASQSIQVALYGPLG